MPECFFDPLRLLINKSKEITAGWKVIIIMHKSFSLIIGLFEELYQTLDKVFGGCVGSIYDVLSRPVLERGLISRTTTGYGA